MIGSDTEAKQTRSRGSIASPVFVSKDDDDDDDFYPLACFWAINTSKDKVSSRLVSPRLAWAAWPIPNETIFAAGLACCEWPETSSRVK